MLCGVCSLRAILAGRVWLHPLFFPAQYLLLLFVLVSVFLSFPSFLAEIVSENAALIFK